MSERKGINKYYPPDWDPSKVPKRQKTGNQDIKVRLMAPFSMRCSKCNEYIAERRKFNAKKEITKEMYMNFKIIRFHITCPRCNNNITFKTSPQTAGYVTETGAVRNYEPKATTSSASSVPAPQNKIETEEEILDRLEREEQENQSYQVLKEKRKKNPFWSKEEGLRNGDDVMENLEKRLLQQQRENEINENLEQLQAKQSYIDSQGGKEVLMNNLQSKLASEVNDKETSNDIDDDEATQKAFENFRQHNKRKAESSEPVVEEKVPVQTKPPTVVRQDIFKPKIVLKRKREPKLDKGEPADSIVKDIPDTSTSNSTTALSTILGYSSDED